MFKSCYKVPLPCIIQVLHEQTHIPGSELKLVYLSSRASGYRPVLRVTLTSMAVPFGLSKVHLILSVEGRMLQKWFPASPHLSYTLIWDKTDAYGQRVYGLGNAVGQCLLDLQSTPYLLVFCRLTTTEGSKK